MTLSYTKCKVKSEFVSLSTLSEVLITSELVMDIERCRPASPLQRRPRLLYYAMATSHYYSLRRPLPPRAAET